MLISVIVPFYHGSAYVAQVLSMLDCNQVELNRAADAGEIERTTLEILCLNDSPEDKPFEGIQAGSLRAIEDEHLRFLTNEENMGIHASRVRGLSETKGELVMFFDQDDLIADNYFVSQLQAIKKGDFVIANGIAELKKSETYTSSKKLYRYGFMQWTAKYPWFYARFDCRIISPGQCLIRRSAIPKSWCEHIMTRNGADDYLLWLTMLSAGARVSLNRSEIYTHVYTETNTSLDSQGMYSSVDEVLAINDAYHMFDPGLARLIRKRNSGDHKKSFLVRLIEGINKAK